MAVAVRTDISDTVSQPTLSVSEPESLHFGNDVVLPYNFSLAAKLLERRDALREQHEKITDTRAQLYALRHAEALYDPLCERSYSKH